MSALLLGSTPSYSQSFDPIRRNLEWSADRNIIDIEVVGSSSLLPERHVLQGDRRLRLRLERAYVSTFFRSEDPGFELLNLAVDMPTELPSAVLLAVARKDEFRRDVPGIPIVSNFDRAQRTVRIGIRSDYSPTIVKIRADSVQPCIEARGENGLHPVDSALSPKCRKPLFGDTRLYLSDEVEGVPLLIECRDKAKYFHCETSLPAEGFAVSARFNRSHLNRWRDIVTFVQSFLKSRQPR